ncbi:queuosine precursor transporter [Deinococcus sp. 6YEL10]|uniref:queuosine precursor transporter n=1 Tax=Deinococcus sp. 6YEL10 TaxID=2745870 RepID=UPI001E425F98|nr:queuosine precursor transporter [Deinococcus sp. 6YEL10]MCD0159816.1 queuosine precursor transporter [Deinococcus sp. 6YEL10]
MLNQRQISVLMLLVALYIGVEVISNAVAGRLVQIGMLVVPGAIFLYALSFTLRDAIHMVGGYALARRLIWAGVTVNLLLACYGLIVNRLPAPGFFDPAAYNAVFGTTSRVVLASVAAYTVSTYLDGLIFERFIDRPARAVLVSNIFSIITDSALFIALAFAGTGAPLLNLMLTQALFKLVISLLLIPLVTRLRARLV